MFPLGIIHRSTLVGSQTCRKSKESQQTDARDADGQVSVSLVGFRPVYVWDRLSRDVLTEPLRVRLIPRAPIRRVPSIAVSTSSLKALTLYPFANASRSASASRAAIPRPRTSVRNSPTALLENSCVLRLSSVAILQAASRRRAVPARAVTNRTYRLRKER
jgi:hypothetical protein